MYDNMIVDARNAVYRAIYAGLADDFFMRSQHDFSLIFFRFISTYVHKFKPKAIHYFWDSPKVGLWRKRIASDYKEGRDSSHGGRYGPDVDVDKILARTTTICQEVIESSNGRNYQRERQEADDLIFAFCRFCCGQKNLIISSDGDFKQVSHLIRNVDLFNPMSKDGKLYEPNGIDPVELKCFTGEKADNIHGYSKIGPVRASEIVRDFKKRKVFLEMRGEETYRRNRVLADLSLCPYLLQNMTYIQEILGNDVKYDLQKIRETIQKYKVRGLQGEISRVLLPFKFLSEENK